MSENKTISPKKKVDYSFIIKDLLKFKMLLIKVLGISFLIGCVIAFSIPPSYKCIVKLSPELNSTKNTSSLASLASSFGVNLKGVLENSTEALFPTLYPDLITSVEFKTELFQIPVALEGNNEGEDRIMSYYTYLKDEQRLPWWSEPIKLGLDWLSNLINEEEPDTVIDPFRLTKTQARIAEVLEKKIICDVDNKTMVISIEVTDQDPVICASMADSVTTRLQKAITEYRTKKARVDLEYHKKMYKEAKEKLEKACEEYVKFADSNRKPIFANLQQKKTNLENEMQLQRTIYTQLGSQLQQAEMKVQEDTPAFAILHSATVPTKKYSPNRKLVVLIVLFLSFIATSIWIFKKEGDLKKLYMS